MKQNAMTEKLKTIINFNIPVWAFGVIIPILVAFISFTINANARATRVETRQEIIEKQLETKVTKDKYETDIKYIKDSLQEIKTDLKTYMSTGKK